MCRCADRNPPGKAFSQKLPSPPGPQYSALIFTRKTAVFAFCNQNATDSIAIVGGANREKTLS